MNENFKNDQLIIIFLGGDFIHTDANNYSNFVEMILHRKQ